MLGLSRWILAQVDVDSKSYMGKIRVRQNGNEDESICNRFLIALWVRLTVWLAFFSRVATISRTEVAVT